MSNLIRRVKSFELSLTPAHDVCRCEICHKGASTYTFSTGSFEHHFCAKCLEDMKSCLAIEGSDAFEGSVGIRESVLKSWRKYFYEKVSTKSFYENGVPHELIRKTLNEIGVEILDASGNPTDVVVGNRTGSLTFSLGYKGKVIKNSVLVLNWYGDEVHGCKGKTELNAYIS